MRAARGACGYNFPFPTLSSGAIRLAREGFELGYGEARSLTNDKGLAQFADSKRIFQNDGKGWKQGDVFRQPELARTLERIVANPDDFYTGKMAREFAEAEAYEAEWHKADEARFHDERLP